MKWRAHFHGAPAPSDRGHPIAGCTHFHRAPTPGHSTYGGTQFHRHPEEQ